MRPMTLLICLATVACHTWQPQRTDPVQYLTTHHPQRARFTTTAHHQLVLVSPTPVGDSIRGIDPTGQPRALAAESLTRFELRRVSESRFLAILTMAALAFVVALCNNQECNDGGPI
jgi:hypothetical protein